jgi:prepilin-type N-terminal cleavage/methylation domain-containing protein
VKRRARNRQRGFTMVELLVTMIIVAIIMQTIGYVWIRKIIKIEV